MTELNTLYQHYLNHRTICTDTRNILEGCLFFALKGDNFNANEFAEKALDGGAAYVIIDEAQYQLSERYLLVEDVLQTLQELAKHHRFQLQIPVIGLTGSNGKTTTKELINAVLSTQYKTFATKGNLNNHIGVPLSLLSITDDIEIAVIEMGANHQKEIEFLCTLAQPTHGMITNVGMAHLDGFGGFEGVKKGKAELFAFVKAHRGFIFINRDNPDLIEMNSGTDPDKVIYYGTGPENAVAGQLETSDPLIKISWSNQTDTFHTSINLTGSYNFENILAAICIGQFFQVSPENINSGLSGYNPVNNRSQVKKTEKNTIICDFYNANPSSMAAALSNLNTLSANQKVAILGDMFELGGESEFQHKHILELAAQLNLDYLIFIGKHFYALQKDMPGQFFITPKEAEDYLKSNAIKDSLILLKGSRGMALEQLLPLL
jgi:UDP-N-acetylmuramoyl-tripeptide--D-alanyl-D-alanine ligase